MIYRHYKGGLYYSIGLATRYSKDFPAHDIKEVGLARYTEAQTDDEKKPVAIFSAIDKGTGSMYYAYDSQVLDGIYTLYKGLDGQLWLRPVQMFSGYLEDEETKRFTKVKGEELFDLISDLLKEKA